MLKKNEQGIVIGTKDEVLWTRVKNTREQKIKELEEDLIVEKAVLKLAEEKILLEKRK